MTAPAEKRSKSTTQPALEDFRESDLISLRAHLILWGLSVSTLTYLIHSEYSMPPAFEWFLLMPFLLALVWRSNLIALAGFLLVGGLQSGLVDRQFQIVRLHVEGPMQFFDMAVAGALILFLASHYCLATLMELKASKYGFVRMAMLAVQGLPHPEGSTHDEVPGTGKRLLDRILQTTAFIPLWPVLAFWVWYGIQVTAATASAIVFEDLTRRGTLPWTVMLLATSVWVLGLAMALSRTVLAYMSWRRMAPEEARVELIDLIWREHRRELDQQAKHLSRASARRLRRSN